MRMDLFKNIKSTKNLAISTASYVSVATFTPLVLIGGSGYFFDKYFNTKPIGMIVGVFLAFITTNILLYRKSIALSAYISSEYNNKEDKEKE